MDVYAHIASITIIQVPVIGGRGGGLNPLIVLKPPSSTLNLDSTLATSGAIISDTKLIDIIVTCTTYSSSSRLIYSTTKLLGMYPSLPLSFKRAFHQSPYSVLIMNMRSPFLKLKSSGILWE